MKTVQQIVAKATKLMVTGEFRSPNHAHNCVCCYCENAAANLLSNYTRNLDAAIAERDKPRKRKLK